MMYYRRKVMLALLQKAGGHLSALRLQKLLFLATRQQVVSETEKGWDLTAADDYLGALKAEDRQLVSDVEEQFCDLTDDQLTRHTYKTYPFFAIRSTVAGKLLNQEELAVVESARPR